MLQTIVVQFQLRGVSHGIVQAHHLNATAVARAPIFNHHYAIGRFLLGAEAGQTDLQHLSLDTSPVSILDYSASWTIWPAIHTRLITMPVPVRVNSIKSAHSPVASPFKALPITRAGFSDAIAIASARVAPEALIMWLTARSMRNADPAS